MWTPICQHAVDRSWQAPRKTVKRDWVGYLVLSAGLACAVACGNGTPVVSQTVSDFSLSVTPSSQTLPANGTATYNAAVSFLKGFASNVTLSVSGLPAGVSASFAPNPLTHEGIATLTLTGNGSVAAGTSTLTVTGIGGGITHLRNVSLSVSTTPDFSIAVSPTSQVVVAGSSGTYNLTLASQNGYVNTVTLSISGLPAGATASFVPQSLIPTGTSTLTVSTASTTPVGTSTLTLTGSDGTLTHSSTVSLDVSSASTGAWGVGVVGNTAAANNSVVLGAAHNDGVNRVYVGTAATGLVIEFSWTGSSWSQPVVIGGSTSGQEIHNMGIGPGRNDGVIRVYAASLDGNLYELSFNGTGWSQTIVGSSNGSPCLHAAVGLGRNDGVNRVYAGRGATVFEYTWNGTGWDAVVVGSVASGLSHGVALGPGRNGASINLYIASTQSGTYEAVFSGGWSMSSMGDTGDVRNVSVGPGRNDGVNRVYAGTAGGEIREFTWAGNSWGSGAINNPVGDVIVHPYILTGRNDGVMRVYGSSGNGNLYEFTFNASTNSWNMLTLTGGAGYMYGMHYGAGRNDGLNRLYSASFNAQVYEYGFSP